MKMPNSKRVLAITLLFVSGCCYRLTEALQVATPQQALANAAVAETKFPQLSQQQMYTRMLAPELVAYVQEPDANCTVIAPDNQAIQAATNSLGSYVGLFMQNKTMQQLTLNYHVIPGRKVRAEEMGTKVTALVTRANETLWFVRKGDQPYASFRRDYAIPLEIVNIDAGPCIMHIISDMLLVPPTLMPTWDSWQQAAGTKSLALPESDWLPPQSPAPGATELPTASEPPQLEQAAVVAGTQQQQLPAQTAAASSAGVSSSSRMGAAVAVAAMLSYIVLV